jgi:hypothetical protein
MKGTSSKYESTVLSTFPEVLVRAECARPACTKPRWKSYEELVPWYLSALPVLRVHVKHGSCPLRVSFDGVEHV